MNIWTFTGRLGADAELRTTQGGDKVLGFRVANDVGFGDRKTTQWVQCSLWGKRAESIARYMTKGKQVCVAGEVTMTSYSARDGSTAYNLSVRVSEVDFFGDSRTDNRDDRPPAQGQEEQRRPPPRHDDLDDEIPF